MSTEDQLQNIIQRWSSRSISTNEIARELHGLCGAFGNAYCREKVRKTSLCLSELTVAARVAGQLQGKE